MIITGPMAAYVLAWTLSVNDESLKKPIDQYFCLAEAIHMEAQGESKEGKIAVANVIMNRVESSKYPNSVCKVVHQKYQFSYRNLEVPKVTLSNNIDVRSFTNTTQIAYDAIQGNLEDNTGGATHYLNPKKLKRLPRWFKIAKVKVKIDRHVFVKP